MFDNEWKKELEGLGLTPAQIKEAIVEKKKLEEKSKELEGKVTTLTTESETIKGEYATTKTRLDELEANVRRPKTDGNEPPKKTDFIDDGDKAFNERFDERVSGMTLMAFNAAKNVARMSAKNSLFGQIIQTPNGSISLTNLWDRWSSELDKASADMMKTNAAALQFEKTWLNLFDYIKGQKIEELMAKPETFFESVGTNLDRKIGDSPPVTKLNDEEAQIAARMARYGKANLTPEKIIEIRKKMKFVGEAV